MLAPHANPPGKETESTVEPLIAPTLAVIVVEPPQPLLALVAKPVFTPATAGAEEVQIADAVRSCVPWLL
jgi:hypothetical protein